MAISPSRLKLPYLSEDFPPGTIPNVSGQLKVTWDEILWAALTIGRPPTHYVFQHGTSSVYEAIFRVSLIRMALEQHGPKAIRLRRTSAFKNLDPTEKGAVSYFLGMVFCKVFASRLLMTPWLLHLDIYKSVFSVSTLGRSRPDLFGQMTGSTAWHAFETKGRATKPSTPELTKAKRQASRLLSIGGTPCSLHVGAFTYFIADTLYFHWVDPAPEGVKPILVPGPGDGWRYYYEPVRSLWLDESSPDKGQPAEMPVHLPQFDLKIWVHRLLIPYFQSEDWEEAQRRMQESHEVLAADGFQPDGVKIECGSSWSERRANPREDGTI